ncbi:tripartite tricarboxylate transporter TctB family protein [Oceanithermus sp.]|uniref:tripartite tricarboxylate transporter TctB family protein n=1 Tax=Oceanithermus sp. TaxID=2268145 RepID=UPI0025F6267B|nr:tripartite tricarboxylate transporter TctB family protein [Oceanithermus sp.]
MDPSRRSDRIVGVLLLLLSIGYGLEALRLQADTGYLADPLGPRAFPLLLAAGLAVLSLYLISRPDLDPAWPPPRVLRGQLAMLVSFVVYSYALAPLGFLLATTLEMAFLSRLFGASWRTGLQGGLGLAVVLYVIFVFGLGIPLPLGSWWPA